MVNGCNIFPSSQYQYERGSVEDDSPTDYRYFSLKKILLLHKKLLLFNCILLLTGVLIFTIASSLLVKSKINQNNEVEYDSGVSIDNWTSTEVPETISTTVKTKKQKKAKKVKKIGGFPNAVQFQDTIREMYRKLRIDRMRDFVRKFSTYFHNRYYNSSSGVKSSLWLLDQVDRSIVESGYRGDASVQSFKHLWTQKSIIARIQGSKRGVVILGAHLDSIDNFNPTNEAPGADDNASGCVVLLETFRILLASGVTPKKSIEFHWYAAEEMGLWGSKHIASKYYFDGTHVVSMVNFDMVGYHTGLKEIVLITDYTNSHLNAFLGLLVDEYLEYKWVHSACGYACSDHAPWTMFGYPAASLSERMFFPLKHTADDTFEQIDFDQVSQFTKLAVAYAIEMAKVFSHVI